MSTAQVVEIPGAITQDRTFAEASERIREAIQAWLDLDAPYAGELLHITL